MINSDISALYTDFYELTMAQGYYYNDPHQHAVFEMFFRKNPFNGGYVVFAGLENLIKIITHFTFSKEDISYLYDQNIFKNEFLEFLKDFKFSGDIYSIPEGTVVFPNEGIIRVHGTLIETQLIESILLNCINFQSLIATKTARIVDMSEKIPVLEFGLRRAQGIDGALSATRAAYIGGASATSNTYAAKKLIIPVSGTMAHSWVMSYDSELAAFEAYADLYPENCILLIDTYDTLKSGVPNAIKVFKSLKQKINLDNGVYGVRIDSGDLEYLSKESRKAFDRAGLPEVKIFVSSDMDESIIKQLRDSNSPIDAWGVGTKLVTGGDDPALAGVYKICAIKRDSSYSPCIKISNQSEKITNPGIKNIMRFYRNNEMICDLLYLEEEYESLIKKIKSKEPITFNHPATEYEGFILTDYDTVEALLKKVIHNGEALEHPPSLSSIRQYKEREIKKLDTTFRRIINPHRYKVSLSDELKSLKTRLIQDIKSDY